MATGNPLDILLAHNHWATRNTLDACTGLTNEQFHRRFEMGPGSLHDTLTHIIGAMRVWTDVLMQRDVRPRIEGARRTIPELLMLLDEAAAELDAAARARPLDETVTREREGATYRFTRGAVVTQVTTHGMHHRAQCLNMLRHCGVGSLPKSSVVEWTLAVDPSG